MKAGRLVLAILLAMPLALLAWGLAEPYFVDRQAYAVHLPGLPAAWNGQTVAVVSDFQVGMWLDNETPGVPGGEESLYLVGIGAHLPGLDDPAGAVDAVPRAAARLVMMHNPDSFAAIPSGAAPLALAGHTHGGQMRLPFTPEWSWMAYLAEDEVHVDGWIEDYGQAGNRLYVNRGIGFSKLPLRINCPPEVTILKLLPGGAPQGKRADGQMARGATAGGTDWQFVFGRVWEVTIDG